MATNELCLAISIGPEVTVESLFAELSKIRNQGRGHYRVQLNTDPEGNGEAVDIKTLNVIDGDRVIELLYDRR